MEVEGPQLQRWHRRLLDILHAAAGKTGSHADSRETVEPVHSCCVIALQLHAAVATQSGPGRGEASHCESDTQVFLSHFSAPIDTRHPGQTAEVRGHAPGNSLASCLGLSLEYACHQRGSARLLHGGCQRQWRDEEQDLLSLILADGLYLAIAAPKCYCVCPGHTFVDASAVGKHIAHRHRAPAHGLASLSHGIVCCASSARALPSEGRRVHCNM